VGDDAIKDYSEVFVKTGIPDLMRVEVEKTRRARKISMQCGLFRVPKVLDYDQSTGTIKFEFMRSIQTFSEAIASVHSIEPLMENLGQSLAIVHKNLWLPDDMVVLLPEDYCLAGTDVFLHGDLSLRNVCFDANNSSQIVILDWQATVKIGEQATYGSRYFDIMWFVYNLFYRPVGRAKYKIGVPPALMAEPFLRGYFKATDYSYDYQEIFGYMKRFLKTRVSAKKKAGHFKRLLTLVPSHVRFYSFLSSFHM